MLWAPHDYQRRTVTHGWEHPGAAWFLDMGLGKTVSGLTLVKSLLDNNHIRGALVVAPLRVIHSVWRQEGAKWDHTRGLGFNLLEGSPVSKTLYRDVGGIKCDFSSRADPWTQWLLTQQNDITLVNYEQLPPLIAWMHTQKHLPFDMLIFDESSKMKAYNSDRFKLIKPLLPRFKRRLILTGTPAPQSYFDLWSQFYLLDGGERLGRFFTHYRDAFFYPKPYVPHQWIMKPGADKEIEKRVADITLSLKADDYLKLPPYIPNRVDVPLPDKFRATYERFQKEMFASFDGVDVQALNAASASSKCRQIIAGAVYTEHPNYEVLHDEKISALKDIVEDAQGSPILVGYDFTSDVARLRKTFRNAPFIGGGSRNNDATVRDWNAGKIPLLFCQPASIAHGLNLQSGGHILVWFTLPWSLESFEQLPARLRRQGQTHPVMIHYLICPRTIDEIVWRAVQAKGTAQQRFLQAIREYRAAA